MFVFKTLWLNENLKTNVLLLKFYLYFRSTTFVPHLIISEL